MLKFSETIPLGPLQQISNSGWVGDFVLPPQATNGQYYLKAREQLAYSVRKIVVYYYYWP